jgi:dihydroorotase (multifunctional complex type)
MALAEAGAVGFKLYTHEPPPDRAREFEGLWAVDEGSIHDALKAVAATGLTCAVHAENQNLVIHFSRIPTAFGTPSRPPVVEAAEIAMLGALAQDTGARVHIAHLTSGAALAEVRAVRRHYEHFTAETCPHYLTFDEKEIERFGSVVRVAPPLRPRPDVEALWEGLVDGSLELVASDHAPFRPEEKDGVPYDRAPQGLPAVETLLPVVMDGALRGRITLERAVDLITSAPARLYGVYPGKGTLQAGADADVTLFDPEADHVLRVDSFLSKAGGNGVAYDGMTLRGKVHTTLVRGRTVFENGAVVGEALGRFVRPSGTSAEGVS